MKCHASYYSVAIASLQLQACVRTQLVELVMILALYVPSFQHHVLETTQANRRRLKESHLLAAAAHQQTRHQDPTLHFNSSDHKKHSSSKNTFIQRPTSQHQNADRTKIGYHKKTHNTKHDTTHHIPPTWRVEHCTHRWAAFRAYQPADKSTTAR